MLRIIGTARARPGAGYGAGTYCWIVCARRLAATCLVVCAATTAQRTAVACPWERCGTHRRNRNTSFTDTVADGMPTLRNLTLRVKEYTTEPPLSKEEEDEADKDKDHEGFFHSNRIAALRTSYLQAELAQIWSTEKPPFSLALNRSFIASGFAVDRCRVLASNHQALVLELTPRVPQPPSDDDGGVVPSATTSHKSQSRRPTLERPLRLVYKIGESVGRDLAVLHIMRRIDGLWKHDGLDLSIVPYHGVVTGVDEGMLEFVEGTTLMQIILDSLDGSPLDLVPFNSCEHIATWLSRQQPANESGLASVQGRFVRSVAGYSVLQYLLRFGDRHASNVMFRSDGTVFHVDFSSRLFTRGEIADREARSMRVKLTSAEIFVLGGLDSAVFGDFVDLACRAFLTLRQHSDAITDLMSAEIMAVPTSEHEQDEPFQTGPVAEWVAYALRINDTDTAAASFFAENLHRSLQATTCCCCFSAVHIWAIDKAETKFQRDKLNW